MTEGLKPCPFCESDYQEMVIDRGGVSYIKCKECGARLQIDTTRCSDTLVPQLYEGLVRMWNRRPENEDDGGDSE